MESLSFSGVGWFVFGLWFLVNVCTGYIILTLWFEEEGLSKGIRRIIARTFLFNVVALIILNFTVESSTEWYSPIAILFGNIILAVASLSIPAVFALFGLVMMWLSPEE